MQYDIFLEDCPARTTLEVLGGTWTVVVISALAERPYRYTDLLQRIGGISRKVLTQVLRRLEDDGLIERSTSATNPPWACYQLTSLGRSALVPVRELARWAEKNTSAVLDARDRSARRDGHLT